MEGSNLHGNWLKDDLPVLIEAVDEESKIQAVIPHIVELMKNRGMVVCMDVDVIHHGKYLHGADTKTA